ncbi:hypothetical protein IPM19_01115 [bacterium]|nr:MAG: hypothetical protein IPM19_01115 [bacterium]
MKKGMFSKGLEVIYIIGVEFIGLTGVFYPKTTTRTGEIVEFPEIEIVPNAGTTGNFFVKCHDNIEALDNTAVLRQDDVLRIDECGQMIVIAGPSRYGNSPIRREIARTSLSQNILAKHNDAIKAGKDQDLVVFTNDGKVVYDQKVVGKNEAIAVMVFENRRGRWFVESIVVRSGYEKLGGKNDTVIERVAKAIGRELAGYRRQPSGVLEQQQNTALRRWLPEAKAQFEAEELELTTVALKRLPRKTVVPVEDYIYTFFRRNEKPAECKNHTGTFPVMDIRTLVERGHSTAIRAAITH